jgi:acyl-coenzyme A thioesterase PaaI-like protein
MENVVPTGFVRHSRVSPLTEPWEPLFSRKLDDRLQIGLHLRKPHTNSRGLMHGGLMATLADNAMGLSCMVALQREDPSNESRPLTMSLGIDFLGKAELGQWILIDTVFVKTGKTICFAQCFVSADGAPVARANATFEV